MRCLYFNRLRPPRQKKLGIHENGTSSGPHLDTQKLIQLHNWSTSHRYFYSINTIGRCGSGVSHEPSYSYAGVLHCDVLRQVWQKEHIV